MANKIERVFIAIYRKGNAAVNGSIFDLVLYEGEYSEIPEFVNAWWKRNARTSEPAYTTFPANQIIQYKKKIYDPIGFDDSYSSKSFSIISSFDETRSKD